MSRAGYSGFGSFHSDDVEVLIRQNGASYAPPPLPFPDPAREPRFQLGAGSTDSDSASTSAAGASAGQRFFGAPARHQFLIDFTTWTFLNAGAFGGPSRAAHEAGERWRRHVEAQPLDFIDRCAVCVREWRGAAVCGQLSRVASTADSLTCTCCLLLRKQLNQLAGSCSRTL
jgi:hypothetical protein